MKDSVKVDVVYDFKHEGSDELMKKGTVHVRVYVNRKRTYVSTGVRILPAQWSDDLKKVIRHPDATELNKIISVQVDKCKADVGVALCEHLSTTSRITHDKLPSSDKMKVDSSDASFLDWMERRIDECGLAVGTVRHHRTVLASLTEHGKIRRFEDVTSDRLNGWLRWVGSRTVQKVVGGKFKDVKIEQVTVYGYWKRVKKWIGVAQEERLLPMDAMCGVKCGRGRSKEREFLTDCEIELLLNAKLKSVHLCRVRDLFLIECGCGLAYQDMMDADFSKLEKIGKMWTLQGRRKKTGEQFFLVLMDWAYKLLKKYDFVLPAISNQKYNKYIGEVCECVGIDKHVTSHVARHTYACYCLRHGVRLEAVQRTLGHSSIKTTQIYAKLVDTDVVDAFNKLK